MSAALPARWYKPGRKVFNPTAQPRLRLLQRALLNPGNLLLSGNLSPDIKCTYLMKPENRSLREQLESFVSRAGLPLGLEAGQHLPGIHARLEDLRRHPAADRLLLIGKKDRAKTALAQHAQQSVGTDRRTGRRPAVGGGSVPPPSIASTSAK